MKLTTIFKLISLLFIALALAACAPESPPLATTTEPLTAPCDPDRDECPEDPLIDCELCDETSTCTAECRDDTGATTTCADAGYCQSCDACGPDVPCDAQCVTDRGRVTTCETQKPLCMRFDHYCGCPVIGGAAVSNIHENDALGPAYMYFASYGDAKVGNIPQQIDGNVWDPQGAWASNFRGIRTVTGGSARPQHEWPAAGSIGTWYPYTRGRTCIAVPAGTFPNTLPLVSDQIYEDDEFVNNDDLVGSFFMTPGFCNTDVWAGGRQNDWSDWHNATTGGDLVSILYRLWCYSCLNAPSSHPYTCSTGVVW